MKNVSLIFIFLFLIPQLSVAQTEWAPIGAEWHYGYWDLHNAPYGYAYFNYRVENDTVYLNQDCRYVSVIEKRSNGDEIAHELFTYEQNDSVFIAFEVEDSFRLMMDYGLEIGDSIELEGAFSYGTGVYVVADISEESFDGTLLKKWSLDFVDGYSGCQVFTEYYEQIGHLYGLINNQLGCVVTEFLRAELRCYEDDNIFIDNRPFGSCDLWGGSLNTEEEQVASIMVYPNPVSDQLFFQLANTETPWNFEIIDNLGKSVNKGILNNGDETLNVENLPPGVYWILFSAENTQFFYRKFLKI